MEERNEQFTQEQLNAANEAKKIQWDARTRPDEYDPVQLQPRTCGPPLSFIDWWNTRSNLLCCFFPFLKCISGGKYIDADDIAPWKEQLQYSSSANPNIPESMRGLWWLKDNIAHEKLVTIFDSMELVGTFNEDGTDGYGKYSLPLKDNWTRDRTCFGHILLVAARVTGNTVDGYLNLKDGKLSLIDKLGNAAQVVYRIDDNEWWKVHYDGSLGQDGDQNINYMYKWVKILDKDGNETEHWNDWKDRVNSPLPNKGCCLSSGEKYENMVYPNATQVVRFKKMSR